MFISTWDKFHHIILHRKVINRSRWNVAVGHLDEITCIFQSCVWFCLRQSVWKHFLQCSDDSAPHFWFGVLPLSYTLTLTTRFTGDKFGTQSGLRHQKHFFMRCFKVICPQAILFFVRLYLTIPKLLTFTVWNEILRTVFWVLLLLHVYCCTVCLLLS